jgi:hypothetical protein
VSLAGIAREQTEVNKTRFNRPTNQMSRPKGIPIFSGSRQGGKHKAFIFKKKTYTPNLANQPNGTPPLPRRQQKP